MKDRKPKPMRRSGPRFTVFIDLNLQWLWPEFKVTKLGIGYIYLGWVSAFFGFGNGRDALWDALDAGTGYKDGE